MTNRTATSGWRRTRRVILDQVRAGQLSDVCAECGETMDPNLPGDRPDGIVIDHIVPLAAGGTDERDNLRPIHRACNASRDDGRHDAYRERRAEADRLFEEAYGEPVRVSKPHEHPSSRASAAPKPKPEPAAPIDKYGSRSDLTGAHGERWQDW